MTFFKSEQSTHFEETLSSYLTDKMEEKELNASQLANLTGLNKSTISRIFKSSNKKPPYCPTFQTLLVIAIVLELGQTGFEKLLFLAYPELSIALVGLDNKQTLDTVNKNLDIAGKPILGYFPL